MKKKYSLIVIITFTILLSSCTSGSEISSNNNISTSVSLNNSSIEIYEGHNFTLIASKHPINATDESLEWSSSNSAIASVTSEGMIIANSQGTAIITVSTSNGKSASCYVNVLPNRMYVNLNSINISEYFEISTSVGAQIGASLPITVMININPNVRIEENVTISVQVMVAINYKTQPNSTILWTTSFSPIQIMFFSGSSLTSSSQSALVFFSIPFDSIITSHSVTHDVIYTFGKISY